MAEEKQERGAEKPAQSKKWNLVLALASILVVAGVLELGTRFALSFVFHREVPPVWRLEYEPYVLHYSQSALRREEIYSERKPKGENYRVLVIGGSTAAQMPDALVETVFQRASERPVEVINLADGGYICKQDLVMLAVHGAKLEPDLIISLDGFNDIVNMTKGMPPGMSYHGRTIKYAVEHPFTNAFRQTVNKSQFVLSMVKLRERQGESDLLNDPEKLDQLTSDFVQTLTHTALLARAIGADYIPVLQPYLHLRETITEDEAELERLWAFRTEFMRSAFTNLESALAEHDFPDRVYYVNAIPTFNTMDGEMFVDQCHLTAPGKEICLDYILRKAQEQGLVLQRQEVN